MSLGLRIVRVCSDPKNRDIRLKELKEQLLERGYNENMVDTALTKDSKVPRLAALRKMSKQDKIKRPVFALAFDLRLPTVQSLQAKHWRTMTSRNKYLKEVFPSPPLTAFKNSLI